MRKLLLVLFLLISSQGFAATITAAVGGGNWSSTASWVGAATPTAADDVLLAVTSGPMTVDVGTAVSKSVTAVAFASNLTFTAGQTLTVSGNVQLNSGMTITGTGVLAINAASNLLSAGKNFTGDIIFNGGAITYTLADAWTIIGSFTNSNLTHTINGNSITIGGSLTHSSATSGSGTTSFFLNGSGTWSGAGNFSNSVTINTSGSITLGNISCSGTTITYVSGTIVNTNSTLTIGSTQTLNTGVMHWNNITRSNTNSVTLTLLSQLIADGTISHTVGVCTKTYSGNFNISCNSLIVPGGNTMVYASGTTLTVSSILIIGGDTTSPPGLQSGTASSSAFLKYSGPLNSMEVFGSNLTDIDATLSSNQILNYFGGTLTRTTNIRNVTLPIPRGFIF